MAKLTEQDKKDIVRRAAKGVCVGVLAEDYFNDKVLEDTDILYSGMKELPQSSALWVKKCLRIRCTSSVKAGSAIASSDRGRGSGTS